MKFLTYRLWRRNRGLRRQLCAVTERDEQREQQCTEMKREIKRLKEELAEIAGRVNQAETRASAEHWKAFKWGENYRIMELDLAATRTERDLAFERARHLAARVGQLEAELERAAR